MITPDQWNQIRRHFGRTFRSSLHYAIATVSEDGTPYVSPIGSLILLEDNRGFYFEYFTRRLPINLKKNQRVAVLAVDSSKWFWLTSLFRGKFRRPPALRLLGTAGVRRKATEREMALWKKRIRPFRGLKGYDLLWSDMDEVREIVFDECLNVNLGEMTARIS